MSRDTLQQYTIKTVLQNSERSLTAEEVLAGAKASCPSLVISTVYRILGKLVEDNEVIEWPRLGKTKTYIGIMNPVYRRKAGREMQSFYQKDGVLYPEQPDTCNPTRVIFFEEGEHK